MELAKRWYEQDDATALPREIANRRAFENAMSSILQWAALPTRFCTFWPPHKKPAWTLIMAAIDQLSRKVPQLCKVAPSTPLYHMEDVHRAGGVMAI